MQAKIADDKCIQSMSVRVYIFYDILLVVLSDQACHIIVCLEFIIVAHSDSRLLTFTA